MYITPKSPKGWHKNAILLCWSVIFNLCRKTFTTKFLCVKTSSGRVVATSLPYLAVHRRIAGDVSVYLKFALKVTHPSRKRRFWQISLNSDSAMRAQRAFHRAIDEPCTLLLSPLNGGSNREFLHFALPFISLLLVFVDTSDLVCMLIIASPSLWRQTLPEMGVVTVTWPL